MQVLLVEQGSAADAIELMLKSDGLSVFTTDLGEEAVDLSKIYDYDAIVLALELPDMSGMEALRQMRTAKVRAPIMILAGDDRVETKVKAFRTGCDDYMTKPFHKDELTVRLQSLIRRAAGHVTSMIEFGNVIVDLDLKVVKVCGTRLHLTSKEYQMLELLALRTGVTLSKEVFLNHLYGGRDEPELKIIDVFICKLRKKLENAGAARHIQTVWGRGYALVTNPEGFEVKPVVTAPAPKRAPLDTRHGRILRVLADGPATSKDLAVGLGIRIVYAVAEAKKLINRGLVVNRGKPRASVFALTQTGVAWLETQGFEVADCAKPASKTASRPPADATEALARLASRQPVGLPSRESAL